MITCLGHLPTKASDSSVGRSVLYALHPFSASHGDLKAWMVEKVGKTRPNPKSLATMLLKHEEYSLPNLLSFVYKCSKHIFP